MKFLTTALSTMAPTQNGLVQVHLVITDVFNNTGKVKSFVYGIINLLTNQRIINGGARQAVFPVKPGTCATPWSAVKKGGIDLSNRCIQVA
jgi:hypothetical protein